MATLNDVMDFAKYYRGKDEPPMFYHEHFDISGKLFVPIDDCKMVKHLSDNPKEQVVLWGYEVAVVFLQNAYLFKPPF